MPQFWLIAVGYLFVAVNLTINGLAVLFPTFAGFALIAAASWSLRHDQKIFTYAAVLAAVLCVLTFPDLFKQEVRGGMETYYYWVNWPLIIFEMLLLGLMVIALWRESVLRGWNRFAITVVSAAAVTTAALLAYFLLPTPNNTMWLVVTFCYWIPAIYVSGLFFFAAYRSGS